MRSVRVMSVIALLLAWLPAVFAQSNQRPNAVEARLWSKLERGEQVPTLIVLKNQVDTSFAQHLPTKPEKNQAVVAALRQQAQRDQAPLLAMLAQRGIVGESFLSVNAIAAPLDLATAQELSLRAEIHQIIDDSPRRMALPEPQTSVARPDNVDAIEWGLTNINAPQVWALGYRGQGIVVAGEDTGIRWSHNAIKNQYRGWNGTTADHNYNWYDGVRSTEYASSCGGASNVPCDDNGHGTHTVGTMVGDDGAGNQIGVAPEAKWIGCRNMDAGNGTIAIYVRCIDWMLAPYPLNGSTANGDPNKAPDVINNSWGCPPSEGCEEVKGTLDDIQPAIQNVTNAGIMFVTSAGNEGSSCGTVIDPPALYPESFIVGAYDSSNAIAGFSSRGPVLYNSSTRIGPDLSAPGVGVRSATRISDTSYSSSSGTSMAAPHVAGVVALLWSARPELRGQVQLTRQILTETATPTTSSQTCDNLLGSSIPNNTFGYGRVNALAAIQTTLQGNVTLNGQPVNATLTLSSPAMEWHVSGAYSTTLPAGTYTLTANIAGLAPQSKTVTITKGNITTADFAFSTETNTSSTTYLPLVVFSIEPDINNRQSVVNFYQQYYLGSANIADDWSGDQATCNAGTPSDAFRNQTLKRINYFRRMAGMRDVTLDSTYNAKAQQAALMMSRNNQLNHTPPTTWKCYSSDGYEGASHSNLAIGFYGSNAINAYMQDFGTNNTSVGHRSWILLPQTKKMGTGDIAYRSPYMQTNALWVIDEPNIWLPPPPTRSEFIAWPPAGFVPYPVVYGRWSFALENGNTNDFSSTTVTMQQGTTHIPVIIESRSGRIVWIPQGYNDGSTWNKPMNDTTYTVTVSNVIIDAVSRSFTYDVTIIDPNQ